jgi:hypothetical protein
MENPGTIQGFPLPPSKIMTLTGRQGFEAVKLH